ncbi:L-ribulose-5-phosphate 4-epimerase AraD [Mucisphaera calidilacus]|uniref:L-ribulose-5-phosphate 4-epimerase n=1 Tax=Mucisphaera calidilacus TaxID=2527982 RepID=A0A518C099_9BACT|nr:L-ribulose-5-phosphate 4-epimerase AraD [Mucisphaera calidilacus]QDU72648.1 L-ribulose-5-phosphate 4-epimerase [Mucisphaera calidilacus]
MLEQLREQVCKANKRLVTENLVTLTWGNVSGISEDRKDIVIKPSGVPYDELTPEQMVIVSIDGQVIDSPLRPSSDTPTHLEIYRHFPNANGIAHTHSRYATIFAQARRSIRCTGTTHADHFRGDIPVTRALTPHEVESGYEHETGRLIVETFRENQLDPHCLPAILLAGHAPFVWGPCPDRAMDNSVALEAIAEMALHLELLAPNAPGLEAHILAKHQSRKHGPDAYYGQTNTP